MRGISSCNVNSARMATVTTVTFIVAFASVLCGLAQKKPDAIPVDCSGPKEGPQEVTVNKPNTTLELKCDTGTKKVTPAFNSEQFKVCTKKECADQPLLSDYIEGATGKRDNDVTATVEITNLPPDPKTFYIQCGETNSKPCYLVVKVVPDKPVVGGNGPSDVPGGVTGSTGGVTPGSPLSCADPGGAITIKLPEKGSTAQFTCGGLTLYPHATDKVFAEDCKKEESLKNIVRSANADVYTLTADKKPPKRKWCYLCAKPSVTPSGPGQASDYCLVHVESSSRTQSSSAVALAAMLPCVLAMLRVT